jgi:hypothetical protein
VPPDGLARFPFSYCARSVNGGRLTDENTTFPSGRS